MHTIAFVIVAGLVSVLAEANRPSEHGCTTSSAQGTGDGADRTAAIYALIGSAELNELNPEAYLRYILERIADHPINRINELLPWKVIEAVPALRLAARSDHDRKRRCYKARRTAAV
jgi:hypothetical protein